MHTCLACGYQGFAEPLWKDDGPSNQICPCCGLHYGYDDAWVDGDRTSSFYRGWRARWQMEGCPWFSQATPSPAGWTADEQLKNLG